jgi:hypothetical protein
MRERGKSQSSSDPSGEIADAGPETFHRLFLSFVENATLLK